MSDRPGASTPMRFVAASSPVIRKRPLASVVALFTKGIVYPHMGWNELEPNGRPRLLDGVGEHPYVYFAHSYYVPAEVAGERAAALCDYGVRYAAAIESENVFGVQFHPEKSGALGQQIVRNFLAPSCRDTPDN